MVIELHNYNLHNNLHNNYKNFTISFRKNNLHDKIFFPLVFTNNIQLHNFWITS